MTAADLDFDDIETFVRKPTDGQMQFVTDLRNDWQRAENELSVLAGRPARNPAWADPTSFEQASEMIENGKAARTAIREQLTQARRAARLTADGSRYDVTEGMWIVGTVGAEGCRIFKVQRAVNGSGRLYAKELIDDSFEYLPGGITTVATTARKMALAEAQAFGRLYGTCCKCGRTLTDEGSIAAGIGPVCAGKGW
jgi:hypothetical protein